VDSEGATEGTLHDGEAEGVVTDPTLVGAASPRADGERPAALVEHAMLFRAMPVMCAVLATDAPRFTLLEVTDAYCAAAHHAREELLGRGLFEAFPNAPAESDDAPSRRIEAALRDSLATVCRTRMAHRMEIQRYDMPGPDGSPIARYWQPINVPIVAANGEIGCIVHQVEDVTSEQVSIAFRREMTGHLASFNAELTHNAEQRDALLAQLEREHGRTSAILESISDIFYAVDGNFRFTYVNRRAEEVWNRRAIDLIGRDYWAEFPMAVGSESHHKHLEVMATRRPVHFETISPVLRRWTSVSIYPSEGGGLSVYFSDIEDRKRAESEREAARAEAESARAALEVERGALEGRVASRTAELADTNAALQTALAEQERSERDRNDLLRMLAIAQEEERRRLSRELHDEVGQHLTALGLELRMMSELAPAGSELADRAAQLREMASRLGHELHSIAVRLRPRALDDFGLEAALTSYAEEWSKQHGIPLDVHASTEGARLPPGIESAVYRIAQEALTNVARHSGASRASLVVERRDGQLYLIVEDDGRGFDPSEPNTASGDRLGLGMLGIRERTALLGGTMEIESARGMGTSIFVRLPIGSSASIVDATDMAGR
jgi:signal transduction histidine kinase